jgi:methanogenic corrinoid protein MtbC1
MEGVRQVGLRYEKGEYFISALIMAGEIMRQASEYLTSFLPATDEARGVAGHVLLGTVKGDIHDLGKNILKNMLLCNGFKVTDLGVDVPAQTFVDSMLFHDPDIVAISCLLTNCLENLVETVRQIKSAGVAKDKWVIVGGSCMDELVNREVKADHWFTDAIQGVNFCLKKTILK